MNQDAERQFLVGAVAAFLLVVVLYVVAQLGIAALAAAFAGALGFLAGLRWAGRAFVPEGPEPESRVPVFVEVPQGGRKTDREAE